MVKRIPLNTVYLHLGSNKNEPLKQLIIAFGEIENNIGPILAYSSFFKTEAWGKTDQADFINAAIKIETELRPVILMEQLMKIEENMGRIRIEKWGPRIIDIDIIFYNQLCIDQNDLTIPHKEMQHRNFVLEPLNEIASSYIHPKLLQTVEQLFAGSEDQTKVTLL